MLYDVNSASMGVARTETFHAIQPLLTVSGGGTVAIGRAELTTEVGVQQGQRALDPARPRVRKAWREFLGSVAATLGIG